jgi:hypothetical protein
MSLVRCIVLLLFPTTLALGQLARQSQPASLLKQPEALVQSLYTQVVAHHPIGIPKGDDVKIIAPYLSKALLHRIDLATACEADFFRQNPKPDLKPAFGWLELGLFSGDEEQASPTAFHIERKQLEKDGTVRVYVELTYNEPPSYSPGIWHVAAIVLRESDHYVVEDVIYLKEEGRSTEARLSARLSEGCDGPRWVGFGDRKDDTKQ